MGQLNYESINIELTKWCNLRCKHCYVIPQKDQRIMDKGEYEAFFKRYWLAGGSSVLLTGGEIFTRKDLKDIVKSAYDTNLSVQLFTNGTLVSESDLD
jgi:MoaA/NifB/PqqE/SkfB family radical SAM enzyme